MLRLCTVCLMLVLAWSYATPLVAAPQGDDTASESTPDAGGDRFQRGLGKLHPLMVHFPIGLLLTALLLEAGVMIRLRPTPSPTARTLAIVGAVGAVVAAGLGWLNGGFKQLEGADAEVLDRHKWSGVAVAGVAVIGAIAAFMAREERPRARRAYRILLVLSAGLVGFTGHEGGKLVYGHEYVDRAIDDVLGREPTSQVETPEQDQPVTYADIAPIMAATCVRCHGPKKQRAGLRVDSREWILKGGEEGPVLVVGKPAESSLHSLLVTDDEDERMPLEEDPIPSAQIEAVRKWIEAGAP